MAPSQTNADEVLPFGISSPRGSIGVYRRIVSLDSLSDDADVHNGRCQRCGYDRGKEITHTEVEGRRTECRQCGSVLEDTVK